MTAIERSSAAAEEYEALMERHEPRIALLRTRLQKILEGKTGICFDIVPLDPKVKGLEVENLPLTLWYSHDEKVGDSRPLAVEPTRISRLSVDEANVLGQIVATLLECSPEFTGEVGGSDQGMFIYYLIPVAGH